jgi:hypothetical protein
MIASFIYDRLSRFDAHNCQEHFLVAQLSQRTTPLALLIVLIDRGMIRDPHELMLLVAEETVLEHTGHGYLGITVVTAALLAILPDGSSAAPRLG